MRRDGQPKLASHYPAGLMEEGRGGVGITREEHFRCGSAYRMAPTMVQMVGQASLQAVKQPKAGLISLQNRSLGRAAEIMLGWKLGKLKRPGLAAADAQ